MERFEKHIIATERSQTSRRHCGSMHITKLPMSAQFGTFGRARIKCHVQRYNAELLLSAHTNSRQLTYANTYINIRKTNLYTYSKQQYKPE